MKRVLLFLPVLLSLACSTTPPPVGNDACDYISSACQGADGVEAEACHDIGHDGELAACEAMLASCLTVCTATPPVDAGPADSGADAGPLSDAGPEDIVVRFSPRVGTVPFSCTSTYVMGSPAVEARPVDLRLYVHDVRLVARDGSEAPLALTDSDFQRMGVVLLDFEDATGSCDQGDAETNGEIRGTAPSGDYVGIRFRLGIPFGLNHVDLTSLPSPLNRTSLFWGWNLGHLFFSGVTRTVGGAGGGGADGGPPDAGPPGPNDHFTHLGSTMCVGDPAMGVPVTSCARPNRPSIALSDFDPSTDEIVVDLAEVKADVNIADNPGCHSFSPPCAFPFDALGLNWATGSETPTTQTVFRVE